MLFLVQEGLDHSVDVVGAAEVVTSDVDYYGVVTTRYMLLNHCPQPGSVCSGKTAVLDVPALKVQTDMVPLQSSDKRVTNDQRSRHLACKQQ